MPETKVAIFDLNETLYKRSSKDEFYLFILKRKKHKVFQYFSQLYYKLLKKLKLITKTEFKENFFNYLDNIPPENVKEFAAAFWKEEFPDNFNNVLLSRIKELQQDNVRVFIITGGLEIYVEPLSEYLKVDKMICTQTIYEKDTYLIKGKACKDEEKIRRLKEYINGDYRIIESYSDSEEAILDHAEKAFLMKGEEFVPYNKK